MTSTISSYQALQPLRRSPHFLRRLYSTPSYTTPSPAGPSEAEILSARSYCSNLLQKYDTPSHTLLAFIPPPSQTAYLALRAFNLEIARIPDTTSTSAVSAMRYHFWRDNINRAFAGHPPKQPVSVLLSHALDDLNSRSKGTASMSKSWFMRIISARETYGDGRPYTALDALEKYAEDTYSTLLYLTLQSLPMASVTADHVASHIGKAVGITTVLRGLPLIAFPAPANHHSNTAGLGGTLQGQRTTQGSVALPLDVMARIGAREEDVLRAGAEAPGLRDAVFEVATRASDHLITARQMLKNVKAGEDVGHDFEHAAEEEHQHREASAPSKTKEQRQLQEVSDAFGVFMPAVSTKLWLDKLQKADFDVFREELRRREWKLPFKAYFAYRRRMF